MEKLSTSEQFNYSDKVDKNQAVLGVLEGPVADIQLPTRNGRLYSEELWEKVFNDEIVKEQLANGGIFGEAQHPVDREEVDPEKIAIGMKEAPTKKNGKLWGRFYILDTPCGRILKTLADFGYKIGISSRGTGETYIDNNGVERVDEDSYQFQCFDAVLLPAVKAARMNLVTESLNKTTLKQALTEALEKSTPAEQEIMRSSLKDLNLSLDENDKEDCQESADTIEAVNDNQGTIEESINETEAVDDGSDIVKSLQEALKENKELRGQVIELQESLSVSYTKEMKLVEQNNQLLNSVKTLTESSKSADALREQVKALQAQADNHNREMKLKEALVESYKEKLGAVGNDKKAMRETLSKKDASIESLNNTISKLNEEVESLRKSSASRVRKLSEQVSELKADSEIKNKQYSNKLDESLKLVEKYKKIAQSSIEKYISCKASIVGVNTDEITRRLGESYTFSDIDNICEDLMSYKRNISKLPFNYGGSQVSKITLKESKPTSITNPDDTIDDSLLDLVQK